MIYIEGNKKLTINERNLEKINAGNYGLIYRDGDKCIKTFYCNIPDRTIEVLKQIREIDDPYLYKIYSFLYDYFDDSFAGYIMKYYEAIKDNIFTMDPDYFKNSFFELFRLAKVLGEKGIIMYDVFWKNCILTKDNIVLIDCDSYLINQDVNVACSNNYMQVYKLFTSILSSEYKKLDLDFRKGINDFRLEEKISLLLHQDVNKLNEKIIDYVRK